MSKTTIQVSEETKAELDALKKGDVESYDAALQRIISDYNDDTTDLDEARVQQIVRDTVRDMVVMEALE